MKNNDKMYVIVRGDLTPGEQIAQSNHASFTFGLMFPELTLEWSGTSNYIAILQTKNEEELYKTAKKAITSGLKVVLFEEPDMNNSLTSICIEPGDKSKKLCSHLKLALSGGK